jgi:hypothetical protein
VLLSYNNKNKLNTQIQKQNSETLKFLEENSKMFCYWSGQWFLEFETTSDSKTKHTQVVLLQSKKKFLKSQHSKESIEWKGNLWKEIIYIKSIVQRLVFNEHKNILQLNSRKNNLIKKYAKVLNRHFSKENIEMTNRWQNVLNNVKHQENEDHNLNDMLFCS